MANNTGNYVSVQDVKDTGIDIGTLTDPQIEQKIKTWMQYIDTRTKNFFNERPLIIKIEGKNTSIMHFPVPILNIDSLDLNSNGEIDLNEITIFSSNNGVQDDRKNPRIKLYNGSDRNNIFTNSNSNVFLRGGITIINGTFGFLEPDGNTPAMIQRAILLLVTKEIAGGGIAGFSTATVSNQQLKREKTDLHEFEYFENKSINNAKSGISSGIKEVDDTIRMYKAPTSIRGSIVDVARPTLLGYM